MEISLIRHGKSKCIEKSIMSSKDFSGWVESYNDNGVFEENFYPSATLEKIKTANIVVTSDLKRSIESAKLLNPNVPVMSTPLFRETELPIPSSIIGGLKLNPSIWALILRGFWFCGYSRDCESLIEAKERAKKASDLLMEFAQKNLVVVVVGHGFFNMLVASELRKKGWKGKSKTSSKHWNCTTYFFLY
ncbi:histidine phosphatase family protein [Sporosarcina sp. D27]|uniref:histidine phosphatase family protein n=1 Tax=Sporosarcina sp. D27 TaxID=1382305 RepID=UPI000471B835|nr:histidine phosphatase family protein [Sporosarcina sp. D27]